MPHHTRPKRYQVLVLLVTAVVLSAGLVGPSAAAAARAVRPSEPAPAADAVPARRAGPGNPGGLTWYARHATTRESAVTWARFGLSSDVPLVGDWDGDGRDTPGVRRGRTFALSAWKDRPRTAMRVRFGRPADLPLVGDWDGDGTDSVGVHRGNTFYLRNRRSAGPPQLTARFGRPGDVPLVGDWDGDGRDGIGVRRGNTFLLSNTVSSPRTDWMFRFGRAGDVPLVGDWDGDGRDTVGVRRGPALFLSNAARPRRAQIHLRFGRGTDEPLSADLSGGGRDAPWVVRGGVFRGSASPLPARLRQRMTGVSWRSGCPVGLSELSLVTIRHWDFAGRVRNGRLVVADEQAQATLRVFQRLFRGRFPLARVRLIDAYAGSDPASMDHNNTSAFNCRRATGGSSWSEHSYGAAIDLNPVQNPYVRGATVLPEAGNAYLRRRDVRRGMITNGDLVTAAFAAEGWAWGGDWRSLKDYQHFSAAGG